MAIALRTIVLAVSLGGCATPTPAPAPSAPHMVGWKRLDQSPAEGAALEQAKLICEEYATRVMNEGTSLFMQLASHDPALKSCMAQKGFLPVYAPG